MPADNIPVIAVATASPIASYRWKNRGRAPTGYVKGMAVAFAEAHRDFKVGNAALATMTEPVDTPDRDILAWYVNVLSDAGLEPPTTAEERLTQLFTIMLGLGMRESSGKHCEGRDMSADNVSADSAEAGLFQVSHDSIGSHPQLRTLFEHYSGRDDLLDVFSEDVHCSASSWENWGEGAGRDFQELTKRCPKFAVFYAGVLLRRRRKHWGPINRKEAEVRPEAATMFRDVKAVVDQE